MHYETDNPIKKISFLILAICTALSSFAIAKPLCDCKVRIKEFYMNLKFVMDIRDIVYRMKETNGFFSHESGF